MQPRAESAPVGARTAGDGPLTVADPARLSALAGLAILDTPAEQGFDDAVRLAARLCAAPVALVSLVAADRQWFKAHVNFPLGETDLDRSVCRHALTVPDLLIIPDLTADARTAGNPLVTGTPFIRFYAGAPLRMPDGHVLGSLCVIDTVPRPAGLTADQADDLRALARQVSGLLAMRSAVAQRDVVLGQQQAMLRQTHRLDVLAKASAALVGDADPAAMLNPILSESAEVLGFDRSYTYDVAPDGRHLRLTHAFNATAEVRDYLRRMPYGAPLCGIVADRHAPLILVDLQHSDDPAHRMARASGLNAYAGYPLLSRDVLRGVMSFASTQVPAFDAETLAFFETLSRLMSAVYERLDGAAARRESESRFRALATAGAQSLYRMDPDWREMRQFDATGFLAGTSAANARWLEDRVEPEDRPPLLAAIGDAVARRGMFEFEHRVRREDGSIGWTVSRAVPILDGGGEIAEWFGAASDVSDRHAAREALQASEAYWRGLFQRLSEGFIVGELVRDGSGHVTDWRYIEVNQAWGDLVGVDARTVAGRTIRDVFPGIEDAWVNEFAAVVETGQSVAFTRQVGTLNRWYEGRAFKLEGDQFGVIFLEVTDRLDAAARQRALLALGDRLRDLTSAEAMTMAACETLGTTLDVMLVGYGDIDPRRETITVARDWTTGGARTLTGTLNFRDFGSYIDDLKRGETVIIPDVRDDPRTRAHADALEARSARAFVNTPVFERGVFVALLFVCTGKARPWLDAELAFIRDVASRLRLAITRVQAEDQKELLNQELSHRLKNTLAMVQAIASQTLRGVAERGPVEALEQRVQALATAHDALLQRSYKGAPIHSIMQKALHGTGRPDRFDLVGPEIEFGPRAALALALVLHELATNASKYGSLSNNTGRVVLTWQVEQLDEPELVIRWVEQGGPPTHVPAHRGFGSRIIRMGLIGTGGVTLDYHPSGLVAVMRAPLAKLQWS